MSLYKSSSTNAVMFVAVKKTDFCYLGMFMTVNRPFAAHANVQLFIKMRML